MGANRERRKKIRLSKDARRLISYWRRSLLEGERESISSQAIRENSTRISLTDFERAHCSPEAHRTLFTKLDRQAKDRGKSNSKHSQSEDDALPVLVCPLRFRRREGNGPGSNFLEVLWLPAVLHSNGTLEPPKDRLPWIARDLLEPSGSEDSPILGTLRALEKFSVKKGVDSWKDWRSYLQYVDSLLKSVTGSSRTKLRLPGYEYLNDALLVCDRSRSGGSQSLVYLLDDILEENIPLGALSDLASTKDTQPTPFKSDKWILANDAKKHLGHFTESFAIAGSQRLAVHRYGELKENEFLGITGPPGTGKTTVLQSIIATAWVEAALKKKEGPPLVACTGATNQSVMNIIDSFEKNPSENNILASRWLPKIHSYGTFCCSQSKSEEVQHYQLELRDGNGLSKGMETEEYLETAERYYLERARAFLSSQCSVEKAVHSFHRLLKTEHQHFVKEIDQLSNLGFLSFLISLLRKQPSLSYEQVFAELSYFDTTRRHQMFLLATHYWEARWLLACRSLLKSRSRDDRRFDSRRQAWERRAMVTPAFVATLAMLPRFFPFSHREGTPPLDLLICDEAGQIPIEMGAPTLALARKAVIVGDCLQLEPFWVVQPHIDRANLQSEGLMKANDEAAWERASERGYLAATGSLMKLALHSSKKSEGKNPGIFLSEQRRSVPELVTFSNALAYGGRLKAKREDLEKRILPAFGFVHVPGTAEMQGSSRVNRVEARELVQWLLEKEALLKQYYRASSLADIVAIITPFAAQHRELRRSLPEKLNRMIVGTVGGLQGAERPVVLFSSVYDDSYEDRFFFDQSVNMLNVAVSRARDSFIVFGDMSIFSPEKKTPSGVLSHFLFSRPENELPLAIASYKGEQQTSVAGDGSERLSSLAEHVHVLKEAFLRARREILLVSPTISSAAIHADRLEPVIRDAVKRGVHVEIFADYDLNREDGQFKPRAAEGFQILRDCGVDFHIAAKIHNKSLAIDGETFISGSFNWLSASRNVTGRFQKHEESWIHIGPTAEKQILRLKDEMAYRQKALVDLLREDEEQERLNGPRLEEINDL